MFKDDWDDGLNRSWWPTRPVAAGWRVPSPAEALLLGCRAWLRRTLLRRSRRDLLDLTDDQLRDIGVSRPDALREAHRSFHLD
ncbi:hypothetical protein GCM10011390_07850 [Aureimonas endophytica]|uniref:YjiS-like domain-containing protein n=2 Tax=Aureimonas endophytica TaxID=2027858 RepID=A0A916ZEN4_9HYPH|nr:hypothetical protein GCM10011390_07850 [Aureimonas endophytica]